MNFLAHAYLSFGHPQVLVGNMISDFVKGRKQYDFPPEVQAGIRLHRKIDEFTDRHNATKAAKEVFRPYYRLYSGAIVDVLYDYYLANDDEAFATKDLFSFSLEVYSQLEAQSFYLPQRFSNLLPYMKGENWLWNYKSKEGIKKSLSGLVRRTTYLTDHETAFRLFNDHYSFLQKQYDLFFKDVKSFAKAGFAQLHL